MHPRWLIPLANSGSDIKNRVGRRRPPFGVHRRRTEYPAWNSSLGDWEPGRAAVQIGHSATESERQISQARADPKHIGRLEVVQQHYGDLFHWIKAIG